MLIHFLQNPNLSFLFFNSAESSVFKLPTFSLQDSQSILLVRILLLLDMSTVRIQSIWNLICSDSKLELNRSASSLKSHQNNRTTTLSLRRFASLQMATCSCPSQKLGFYFSRREISQGRGIHLFTVDLPTELISSSCWESNLLKI